MDPRIRTSAPPAIVISTVRIAEVGEGASIRPPPAYSPLRKRSKAYMSGRGTTAVNDVGSDDNGLVDDWFAGSVVTDMLVSSLIGAHDPRVLVAFDVALLLMIRR
jgi:hypothetical protein